jgi:hypothetical protein
VRAAEHEFRIHGRIEEIRAAEVRIASLHARFDARCVNMRLDRRAFRVGLVEVDVAVNLRN